MNMEIINDLSHMFDTFMIDLTNIGSGGKETPDKAELIAHFEQLLSGEAKVSQTLHTMVPQSTNEQYHNGL